MRSRWNKKTGDWEEVAPGVGTVELGAGPLVMSDIEGFYEPGGNAQNGGKFIDGRSDLRNYERANGVRQVGNDLD
jgi:hypothetical protein